MGCDFLPHQAKAKAKAKKEADEKAKAKAKAEKETSLGKKGKGGKKKGVELDDLAEALAALKEPLTEMASSLHEKLHQPAFVAPRLLAGLVLTFVFFVYANQFYEYSHMFAERSSSPQIMFKARLQNGKEIIVDDYREAYVGWPLMASEFP